MPCDGKSVELFQCPNPCESRTDDKFDALSPNNVNTKK